MFLTKAKNIGLGILLMVGVFGYCGSPLPFRTEQEVVANLACILLIAFFLIKNIWLKLFLVYCVVNVYLCFTKQSLITLRYLAFYAILYQVLVNNLNEQRIKAVWNTLALIAVVQSAVMILEYNGIWLLMHDMVGGGRANITGITSNPNIASALLAMCVPAFFVRKSWVLKIGFCFSCIAQVMNGGLQGILATVVILTLYIVRKYDKVEKYWVLTIIVALVTAWLIKSGEWQTFVRYDRLPIWKFYVMQLIPVKPFIGCGLGNGYALYPFVSKFCKVTEAFTHPHNEFIFLMLETGIIGFGLMMGFIVSLVKRVENIHVFYGIIASLFLAFVGFPFHVTIGIIPLVYFAIAERSKC